MKNIIKSIIIGSVLAFSGTSMAQMAPPGGGGGEAGDEPDAECTMTTRYETQDTVDHSITGFVKIKVGPAVTTTEAEASVESAATKRVQVNGSICGPAVAGSGPSFHPLGAEITCKMRIGESVKFTHDNTIKIGLTESFSIPFTLAIAGETTNNISSGSSASVTQFVEFSAPVITLAHDTSIEEVSTECVNALAQATYQGENAETYWAAQLKYEIEEAAEFQLNDPGGICTSQAECGDTSVARACMFSNQDDVGGFGQCAEAMTRGQNHCNPECSPAEASACISFPGVIDGKVCDDGLSCNYYETEAEFMDIGGPITMTMRGHSCK